MSQWINRVHFGDCLDTMRGMPDGIAQTCVTSPPYFGLRDYGHAGQIGLEPTPDEYVAKLVAVFAEVRRVLRDDGTLWLNLGDTYNAYNGNAGPSSSISKGRHDEARPDLARGHGLLFKGAKPKDLLGIPWRVAFALQADGWWLRQDIIWNKPNPMPESIRDRCTKSHEYVFLLAKSERYYCDMEAIKEPAAPSTVERLQQDVESQQGSLRVPGKTNGPMKAVGQRSKRDSFKRDELKRAEVFPGQSMGTHRPEREENEYDVGMRNKRSVWTVSTKPFTGAHFATFPPELIEPCILAGAPGGGVVLEPFMGSGTTGAVAQRLGRAYIGCELNRDYEPLQQERLRATPGLEFA